MPTAAKYIFNHLSGVFKNAILDYGNVENRAVSLAYMTYGIRLENITTEGSIKTSSNNSTTNYSPLIGYVRQSSQFINCTNNLDISGVNYGSAFVGGYVYVPGASRVVLNSDGTLRTEYLTEGFIGDICLEFKNCVNNANINMKIASMLYGNTTWMPLPKNVIVEDCVNNGKIVGTNQARLFSGMADDGGHNYADNVNGLAIINDAADLQFTGKERCFVNSLTGLSLTKVDGELFLNIPEGEYTYKFAFDVLFYNERGSILVSAAININNSNRDPQTGKLIYGQYRFIDKHYLDSVSGSVTKTKIDAQTSFSAELYLVECNNQKFYYFDLGDEAEEYYIHQEHENSPISRNVSVYAYDVNGNIVGESTVKYK